MASDEEGEETRAPRRSTREGKQVKRLGFEENPSKRRKLDHDEEDEDENQAEEEEEAAISQDEQEPDEDEFDAPKATKPRRKSGGSAKGTSRRRSAKKRADDDSDEDDASNQKDFLKGEYNIAHDNTLFEAVRSTGAALADTVGDWVAEYQASDDGPGTAMAQFVDFLIRACGCNLSVDRYEVEDVDSAADKLEEIQEKFKKVGSKAYPLVGKVKSAKAFRKSLSEFLSRLIEQADEAEILYDDFFTSALHHWLAAATSSKLRSFRHTSTIIALDIVSALCTVAAERDKELTKASRALDTGKEKQSADKKRLQALEANRSAAHQKKVAIEAYFKSTFNAIFVLRYRDAEPAIRTACIKALGGWMKKHSDYWLSKDHLKYLGWQLTDQHKDARLAAVTCLHSLFQVDDFVGGMRDFTTRFRARLVELATSDIEMPVRIAAIDVLSVVTKHGLLSDELDGQLARLIYHVEPKVRKAIAPFFASLVKEAVAQAEDTLEPVQGKKKGAHAAVPLSKEEKLTYLGLKSLAAALLEHAKAVGDPANDEEEEDVVDEEVTQDIGGQSRISTAVEALYDADFEPIQDWQAMIEYLAADHSDAAESQGSSIEPALRLTEEEESLVLEFLIVTARCTRAASEMASKKDNDPQDALTDMSRALIKVLPKLMDKYKSDARRVANVLLLLTIIDLDLYFSLRMIGDYEKLWDEVTDIFVTQSDAVVFEAGLAAVAAMRETVNLSKSNDEKLTAFDDAVLDALEAATKGKDVSTAGYTPDQLRTLTAALKRLSIIVASRDLTSLLSTALSEGQPSTNDIVQAATERGSLGYADEDELVEHALKIQWFYLIWRTRAILQLGDRAVNSDVEDLVQSQQNTVKTLVDLVVSENSSASNAVREWAFALLLDLYTFFGVLVDNVGANVAEVFQPLQLSIEAETAFRMAGFLQGVIERYSNVIGSQLESKRAESEPESEPASDEGEETLAPKLRGKIGGALLPAKQAAAQAVFRRIVSSYVRCLHTGILDLQQASALLSHFGRFDAFFDASVKHVIAVLRAEGPLGDKAEDCTSVLIETLREATEIFVNSESTASSFNALGKALCQAVVARRGALTIVGQLPAEQLLRLHTELVTYIVKQLAELIEQHGGITKQTRLLLLFKTLHILATTLIGRDALKIQTHLDDKLKQADIKATNADMWTPFHAYVKRLASAMSKDASIKQAARKRAVDADGAEGDENGEPKPKRKRGTGKPRAKPKARKEAIVDYSEDELDGFAAEVLPTKKDRATQGRRSPAKRKRSPVEDGEEEEAGLEQPGDDDEAMEQEEPQENGINGHMDDGDEEEEAVIRGQREGSEDTVTSQLRPKGKKARL